MIEKTPRYTTILHEVRIANELSCNEYCVADIVYHLSNNPKAQTGWCYASKETLASYMGVNKKSIHNIINNLIEKNFVEKNEETKHLRTTQKWYDTIVLEKIKYREESSHIGVKKVPSDREESSHNNNIYNNSNKKDFSKEKSLSISSYKEVLPLNNKDTGEITEVKLNEDGEEIKKPEKKIVSPQIKNIKMIFVEMCKSHVGQKSIISFGKAGSIIKSALREISEKDILDLFEWWFLEPQEGKKDYDLIQITQALSSYNISKYKMQHGK